MANPTSPEQLNSATALASRLAYIAALQAVVTSATNAINNSNTPRVQLAAERQAQQYAAAALLLAQQALQPALAPLKVVVQPGDTFFSLAQQYLGSALKYPLIMKANGYIGLNLTAGTVLVMPAPQ